MKKIILCCSAICLITFAIAKRSTVNKTSKTTQVRIFTINKDKMVDFLDAWQKSVYPLRIKNGFKIEGAWVVKGKNKFIWIISYEGTESFNAKDSAYYASQARVSLDPDPAQYISDVEKYFIEPVKP